MVTTASQLTVYWLGLASFGGRLSWQASRTVTLGDMRGVPAADAAVAAAPGGKLHATVVLHDYPGDGDSPEEHVVVRLRRACVASAARCMRAGF